MRDFPAGPRIFSAAGLVNYNRVRWDRTRAPGGGPPIRVQRGHSSAMAQRPAVSHHGLTNYGDGVFSLYLRPSFAQSMGYSQKMRANPGGGIAYPGSGFNNSHRHFPELLE